MSRAPGCRGFFGAVKGATESVKQWTPWRIPLALWGGLGAAVLWRGAFPVPYALVAAGLILVVMVGVWRRGARLALPATPVTAAWGVLLAAYGAALTGAVDLNQALIGTLVLGAGVAVYWGGRRAFAGARLVAFPVGLAALSGLAALVGLAGLAWPHGILANLVDPSSGRLAGVVEYTNAAGILAVMGTVAAWTAAAVSGRVGRRGLEWAGALSVAALLLTESIGASLVFGVITVVWLVRAPKTWATVAATLLSGGGAYLAGRHLTAHPTHLVGVLVAIGLAVPLAAGLRRGGAWVARQNRRTVWVGVGVLVVLFGALLTDGTTGRIAGHLVPAAFSQRWVGLKASGFYDIRSRFAMWTTGARLVATHPLRGLGAGGWASAYLGARPWPFTASAAHSSVVQVATDAGVPGLVAWLGLWAGTSWLWWQTRRRVHPPLLADGVALLLAALLAHSLMDWDLAIPGLAWVGWAGLGALGGQTALAPTAVRVTRLPWILAALGALLAGALAVGQFAGASGDALLSQGRALSADYAYATAVRWDPLAASFHYDLAQINQQLAPVSARDATTADRAYATAVRLSPDSYLYHARYGQFLAQNGDPVGAEAQLARALRDGPDVGPLYAYVAGIQEGMGYETLAAHHRAAARPLLEAALATARRFTAMRAIVNRRAPVSVQEAPEPQVDLYAGMAAALLKKPVVAAFWLRQDPTVSEARAMAVTVVAWEQGQSVSTQQAARFARQYPGFRRQLRQIQAVVLDP